MCIRDSHIGQEASQDGTGEDAENFEPGNAARVFLEELGAGDGVALHGRTDRRMGSANSPINPDKADRRRFLSKKAWAVEREEDLIRGRPTRRTVRLLFLY